MDAAEKKTYEIMANALFDAFNAEIGYELPKVPVKIGPNSMTSTAGRLKYAYCGNYGWGAVDISGGPSRRYAVIILSPVFIEKGHGEEILVETLKHEMVHLWQLRTRGVVDHGSDFKKYCLRLRCNPATYHNIGEESPDGQYVYYCPVCGDISRFNRRVDRSGGGTCDDCTVKRGHRVFKQYIGTDYDLQRLEVLRTLVEDHGLGQPLVRVAASEPEGACNEE